MTNLQAMETQENAKFHKIPSACKVCLYIHIQMCPCLRGIWALACLLCSQTGVRLFLYKKHKFSVRFYQSSQVSIKIFIF